MPALADVRASAFSSVTENAVSQPQYMNTASRMPIAITAGEEKTVGENQLRSKSAARPATTTHMQTARSTTNSRLISTSWKRAATSTPRIANAVSPTVRTRPTAIDANAGASVRLTPATRCSPIESAASSVYCPISGMA